MGNPEQPGDGDILGEMMDPVIKGAADEAARQTEQVYEAPANAVKAAGNATQEAIDAARQNVENAAEGDEDEE